MDGKADTSLKGAKFIRLERRTMKESNIQVRRYKNGKTKAIVKSREVQANNAPQFKEIEVAEQETRQREKVYWPVD